MFETVVQLWLAEDRRWSSTERPLSRFPASLVYSASCETLSVAARLTVVPYGADDADDDRPSAVGADRHVLYGVEVFGAS